MNPGFTVLVISTALLFSCQDKPGKKEKAAGTNYKNGISLQAKGFKIKGAYLAFDDKTSVPDDNKENIGQHVNLQILINSGWEVENGRIYPGIYQKVESDDGKHVFEKADLMQTHPQGVPAEDGWLVTIQAVINSLDKHYDYFLVTFRVWDKKSDAEIKGTYKLHPRF
jgi:hypothetical protein